MPQPLGIYIHIPFCAHKCAYCDFYSVTDTGKVQAYIDALTSQIKSFKKRGKDYTLDTVYIGGGTPSYIDPSYITDILDTLRKTFRFSECPEITIEANPGTLDGIKLSSYRNAGINRLSIGLQSADNDELKRLSRIHTWEDFENSFLLARLEGFDNISVDIMYALPFQKRETLSSTIDSVAELSPEHISFYGLKIEENTPFGNNIGIASSLPDEETQYKMYMESAKKLEDLGYAQYEISNFAKPGKHCRHNMKYWKCASFLGFGAAASSLFEDELFSYIKNIDYFIENPTDTVKLMDSGKVLTNKELATQFIMLGLRLSKGVDTSEYALRFGGNLNLEYGEKLRPYIEKKLAVKTATGFRLTRRGMLVSNYILSSILDFDAK